MLKGNTGLNLYLQNIQQSWQTSALVMHLPLACLVSMSVIFCLLPSSSIVRTGLYFTADVFFSPRFLRDPSTDRPETWEHGRNLTEFYKLTSKIPGALPPKNWILGAKNMQNFRQFCATSDWSAQDIQNRKANVSRSIPPAFNEKDPVNFGPLITEI